MELFEVFVRDNPNGSTSETLDQSRTVVRLFSDFVGKQFPANAITKKEVREWKSALRDYPVKATETSAFKDMGFRQIVEANRRLGKRAISDKTLNRYLAALGSFCKWLVAHGYLNEVPTSGMFIKIDKAKQKVFPYKPDDLQAIFTSPLYTGAASKDAPHRPGTVFIRDHRFWLPLMSLFSGARLGELCQLTVDDLTELQGRWVFRITTESSEEQHLKTKGSQRIVPVHSQLVELGIVDHLKQVRKQGHRWLFPEITPCSRSTRSGR